VCIGGDTCTCNSGWTGARCAAGLLVDLLDVNSPAVCTYSCVQGSCTTPNTCTCNGNWGGPLCDRCADGWTASDCQTREFFEFSFFIHSQPSARKVATMAPASNLILATATRAGLVRDAACASLSSVASTVKFVGLLIAFELIYQLVASKDASLGPATSQMSASVTLSHTASSAMPATRDTRVKIAELVRFRSIASLLTLSHLCGVMPVRNMQSSWRMRLSYGLLRCELRNR
jgi:hypothetical protein